MNNPLMVRPVESGHMWLHTVNILGITLWTPRNVRATLCLVSAFVKLAIAAILLVTLPPPAPQNVTKQQEGLILQWQWQDISKQERYIGHTDNNSSSRDGFQK